MPALPGEVLVERVVDRDFDSRIWNFAETKLPLLQESGVEDHDPAALNNLTSSCGSGERSNAPTDESETHAIFPVNPVWTRFSLRRDCGRIDVFLPEIVVLDGQTFGIKTESFDPEVRTAYNDFIDRRGRSLRVLPTVQLGGIIDPQTLLQNLRDPMRRATLTGDLVQTARNMNVSGLCIDTAGWPNSSRMLFGQFLGELSVVFAEADLERCIVTSIQQGFWRDPQFHAPFDRVVMRTFVQPWIASAVAPLADQQWFEESAQEALTLIGHQKLAFSLGTNATDWIAGRPMPEKISFAEAMTRAAKADASVQFDPVARNSFVSFLDDTGQRHQIWLLDAASVHNQVLALRKLGVTNIGLSDTGYEDPGAWAALGAGDLTPGQFSQLAQRVGLETSVNYTGEGPFLRYQTPASVGRRKFEFDPETGEIISQTYVNMPASASIRRFGRAAPNQIVLTFDDGPHPEYTSEILDVLKREDVPAAFFVVGSNAVRSQSLVNRIVDEGHEIGSHTYLHPQMPGLSPYRSAVEVNSVQKLINGITGRSMLLYREPFLRNSGPLTEAEAESVKLLQSAGYIVAGGDIVPSDWKNTTAEEIVEQVVAQVYAGQGNVIVMHDAGSDRSETVKAVPMLIAALREQGYEFVSMAEILGTTRDRLMPPVSTAQPMLDNFSFNAMALFWDILFGVFWMAIIIGVGRSIFMLTLALIRKPPTAQYSRAVPSATVVIPAYNEEVVIRKSVQKVLTSPYPGLRVIVVDDGSRDRTLDIIRAAYGTHPRVRIMSQRNQGKWAALNTALRAVETDLAICIDADTQIDRMSITWLCRHFADPTVGAVAGKILVGNRKNLLTRLQALEYITAQNIDRRAMELVNGMLVVPGAIGAWRVEAIRAAGYFSGTTMSEDADLTVSVARAGYRVAYDEFATAHTEAPATFRTFLRQRLRWSLGMLQVGWKHKTAVMERRAIGCISLPDLAIFGYIFPLIAPIADMLFFYFIYDLVSTELLGQPRVTQPIPSYLFLGYLALPLMDIVTAAAALWLDRTERWRQLLLFPLQRLLYRQLLYFAVFLAIGRAISGRLAKWQKGERSGFTAIARSR